MKKRDLKVINRCAHWLCCSCGVDVEYSVLVGNLREAVSHDPGLAILLEDALHRFKSLLITRDQFAEIVLPHAGSNRAVAVFPPLI